MRGGTEQTTKSVIVVAIDAEDAIAQIPPLAGVEERSEGNVDRVAGAVRGPWSYVFITPITLHRARGVVADDLIVSKTMRESPELAPLVKAISPCFATTGGIVPALERAEIVL